MVATWLEKYMSAKPTYTRVNDKRFADLEAGTAILIPSPQDIEAEIARLGREEKLEFSQLRRDLADTHHADGTCPVMCGMNLRIVAEVAFEAMDSGVAPEDLTPVWNAIEPNSNLARKLPGGPDRVASLRGEA